MDLYNILLAGFYLSIPYLLVIFFALVLSWMSITIANKPYRMLSFMAFFYILQTSLLGSFSLNLGLYIYPPDLFVLVLFPAFIYRIIILKKINFIPIAWWILGLVQISLFIWGLMNYGTAAGVDYRPYFYVWLGAAYLATFKYDQEFTKRIFILCTVIATSICLIAYYRWGMSAIDYKFYLQMRSFDSTGVDVQRVIASGPMFIVAIAFFISVHHAIKDKTRPMAWVTSIFFAATILAMQHRSIWLSSIAGLIGLLWALSRVSSLSGSRFLAIAFSFLLLIFVSVSSQKFDKLFNSVEQQAALGLSTSSGTFVGRIGGWQELLYKWIHSDSFVTYAVGKPFGSGYDRFQSGAQGIKKVQYMPHNYYIALLYRGGLISLFAFLWLFWRAYTVLTVRIKSKQDPNAPIIFAMLIGLLIYFIPYQLEYPQMIIFGLLLSLIKAEEHRLIDKKS